MKEKFSLKGFFVVSLVFFSLIFLINFSYAAFNFGVQNHSVEKTYGAADTIRGWVNLSFSNEAANSVFNSSFAASGVSKSGNSVKLIDLLKMGSYNYSCAPFDCSNDYTATNPGTQKNFSLNGGQEKLFGFNITGNVVSISSISFSVQSSAGVSCTDQLKIDLFNDGQTDFINNKSLETPSCSQSRSYGCYTQTASDEEYTLTDQGYYCQKVNLTESPGFFVGAWIKNTTSGTSSTKRIFVSLFKDTGDLIGNCEIKQQISSSGQEVSCEINYTATAPEQDYACIYTNSGTGTYNIRGHSSQQGCGFFGSPGNTLSTNAAYDIFSEGKQFDSPGTIQVPNTLPTGDSFGDSAFNYILSKYGNSILNSDGSLNCVQGCIVPVKIVAGTDQQIILSNLAINYQKDIGFTTDNKFYDLTKIPAKISAGFQKIYLNGANLTVPSTINVYDFSLKYNNSLIFTDTINVTNVLQILSLNPLMAPASYPTEFNLLTSSDSNISSIFWDFGDNSTATTTKNNTKHTYTEIGIYNLTVNVTDIRGLSSTKTFEINVTSPKDIILPVINQTRIKIANIKSQTSNLDDFSKQVIYNTLNLDNISSQLDSLTLRFNQAQTDDDYNQIATDLLKINLPDSIFVSAKTSEPIPFIPDKSNVDINSIALITGENFNSGNTDSYKDSVILWGIQNLDVRVGLSKYTADYSDYSKDFLTVINLEIAQKNPINGDYYLILPKLQDFNSQANSNFNGKDDILYTNLKNFPGNISFSTTEEINIENLPIFISPKISNLSVSEISGITPVEKPSTSILIIALAVLVVLSVVIYLGLKFWYKRNYENYLFKNKNDLYNLATYITNAKKKGVSDKEIVGTLKKAKWSSEQIKYVMKKYAGKKIGMPI